MATTYNSDGQKTNRPSCMPASLNKYYILVNEWGKLLKQSLTP